MSIVETRRIGESGLLNRALPLTGVAFALLTMAGNLIIGKFPDGRRQPHSYARITSVITAMCQQARRLARWRSCSSPCSASHCGAGYGEQPCPRGSARSSSWASRSMPQRAVQRRGVPKCSARSARTKHHPRGASGLAHRRGPEIFQATAPVSPVVMIGVGIAGLVDGPSPDGSHVTGLLIGVAQLTPASFLASLVFLAWCAVTAVVLTTRTQTERRDV